MTKLDSVCRWVLLACALAGATVMVGLSGCATPSGASANASDVYTESDEPQNRKRAANRLRLAVLYFGEGKFSVALDEVKQAIAADPDWFEAYSMRGLIYMRMSNYVLADASFQKALALNPGSAEVKHNYGVTLCKENRVDEALRMFSAAIATPGYNQKSNTWMEQGACLLSVGKKQEAELAFTRSYGLDPGNMQSAYQIAALLFQRGEVKNAQPYIRRVNALDSASADSLWLGLKIERRLGNAEAVAQLGGELRKKFPQSLQAMALERSAFDE